MRKQFISIVFIISVIGVTAQNNRLVYNQIAASLRYRDFNRADSLLHTLAPADSCVKSYYSGLSFFMNSRYEEAVTQFSKAHSYADADIFKTKSLIRLNQPAQACDALKNYLKKENKKAKHQILLDQDISSISNNRDFVELWKTEWYSELEAELASIELRITLNKDIETLDYLKELEIKYPKTAQIHFYQSLIWTKLKAYKNALEEINKALNINPRVEYFDQLGRIYIADGKYEDAELAYYKTQSSDSISYHIEYAKLCIRNKKYEKAIKILDEYLSVCYKSDEALYYKASSFFMNNENINALLSINKAIAINPYKTEYLILRSDIFYETKNYVFAENDLTQALDIKPMSDIYFKRGEIRELRNNTSGACMDFSTAYKLGRIDAQYKVNKLCSKK